MAQMQIRTEDKVNLTDAHKHAQLSKRGECISIVGDHHEYSPSEKALYAIVSVPGVAEEQLTAFLVPDVHDHHEHRLLRRRAFYFDLDNWNGKALTLAEALALKVRHELLLNPDILGMAEQ